MKRARFILIGSKKEITKSQVKEWIIEEGRKYILGRNPSSDIYVNFDPSVSGVHAEIWFEDDALWIEDKSRYGTKLNGEDISKRKAKLEFDSEISIGNRTTFTIVPLEREFFQWENIQIELEALNSINYALLHNRFPLIKKFILRNLSQKPSHPLRVKLELGNYWNETYDVPEIQPFKSYLLNADIKIESETMERQTESSQSYLKIFINDSIVFKKNINILAFNEWSLEEEPFHRTTLASFVQPEHPFIHTIRIEARELLRELSPGYQSFVEFLEGEEKDKVEKCVEAIYDYFLRFWKIRYAHQPFSSPFRCQRIRFPHQVLVNWNERKGIGTCLDLSILMSSCMENIGLKPFLVLLEEKPPLFHAMTGCWKNNPFINEPLIKDKDTIKKELIVECTGITKNMKFYEACEKAKEKLENSKFLFALDISSARRFQILPLPFSGEPKISSYLMEIDRKAKNLAIKIGEKTGFKVYSPAHILLALLSTGNNLTGEIFKKAGCDIKKLMETLQKGLSSVKIERRMEEPTPSEHYQAVWTLASSFAKREGSPLVIEKHLFLALLEAKSKSIEEFLKVINLNAEQLKKITYSIIEEPGLSSDAVLSKFSFS